jgi:hypothetical protein
MITNETVITRPEILKWFHRTNNNEVFVKSSCVYTENPYTLKIGETYEIHDMTREGVNLAYVRLLWVYVKGMTAHFIAVEIQTGELMHFSQRLGSDSLPCDYLICDLLYFDGESLSTKILRGLTSDDMQLLEFEFGQNDDSQ